MEMFCKEIHIIDTGDQIGFFNEIFSALFFMAVKFFLKP